MCLQYIQAVFSVSMILLNIPVLVFWGAAVNSHKLGHLNQVWGLLSVDEGISSLPLSEDSRGRILSCCFLNSHN